MNFGRLWIWFANAITEGEKSQRVPVHDWVVPLANGPRNAKATRAATTNEESAMNSPSFDFFGNYADESPTLMFQRVALWGVKFYL